MPETPQAELAQALKTWTSQVGALAQARFAAAATVAKARADVEAAEATVKEATSAEELASAQMAALVRSAAVLNPAAVGLHNFADGLRSRLAAGGPNPHVSAVLQKAEQSLLASLYQSNGVTVESLQAELDEG